MKNIIETLTAIAPFLQPYPSWVKVLVVAWVMLSAVLLVALILARPPQAEKKPAKIETARDTSPDNTFSVETGTGDVSIENVGRDKVGRDKIEGDKIERQVILTGKKFDQSVVLETFSIDSKKCNYKQHNFDPQKPLWPEDEDAITVVYHPDGKIGMYGKTFSSRKEAEEYGDRMKKIRNHYSFSEQSIHKIYLERLEGSAAGNDANYPVFYISISNHKNKHIVLSALEADVLNVTPLVSIGDSHSLLAIQTYELELPPSVGSYRKPMIPNIKIESGDAAAFEVVLKPQVQRMGGVLLVDEV